MTTGTTPSRPRWYPSLPWWQRGFFLGAVTLACALPVLFFLPADSHSGFIRPFYVPGIILLLPIAHGPSMGVDKEAFSFFLKCGNGVAFLLLSCLAGFFTRRLWLACIIIICPVGFFLALDLFYNVLGPMLTGC